MVSHMHSSSGASITRVTLDLLPKCSVMVGLVGCRFKMVTTKNLWLVWNVFFSLSLYLFSLLTWSSSSSLSSQSNHIWNSFRHVVPSGVPIAQYPEYSVNLIGASGEVGDSVDGVSIGWLVCMGARLVIAPATSLAFQEWRPNFTEWPQEVLLHFFSGL